ncbi:HD-GYP domain-containing protein [Thermodesulfobacteriota bacterium]
MNFISGYLAKIKDPKNPTAKLNLISFALIFSFAVVLSSFVSYYLTYNIGKDTEQISRNLIYGWAIVWGFTIIGGTIIHLAFVHAMKRNYQQNRILEYELIEYSKELERNISEVKDAQNAAIFGLSKLAEYRDKETGEHLERMSLYSRMLAEELSKKEKFKFFITKDYIEAIYISSVLHDIGKVGIPDAVLLKPGAFTEEEWAIMKTHAKIGGDALAAAAENLGYESFLTIGKDIAYYHHENYDGNGYPFGLKGDDIPLAARIIAFADAYDAITSKRVYKSAQTFEEAKELLKKATGSRYDPDTLEAFLSIADQFKEVAEKYQNAAQEVKED